MYYQNYEDYMRSVLGYPIEANNTYEAYSRPYENTQIYSNSNNYDNEILNLYPEIYRIVNPMVCKICDANTKPITRELVEQMTDEIYMNLEIEPEVSTVVNIRANAQSNNGLENNRSSPNALNTSNKLGSNSKNSTSRSNLEMQQNSQSTVKEKQNNENRGISEVEPESRQRRPDNRFLKDLIRILILNRLLGRGFPNRPRPPRRPPFLREDRFYENYLRY